MLGVQMTVIKDNATPLVRRLSRLAATEAARRRCADACAVLTQEHIRGLGPNKRGWPSTHFYRDVANDGVDTELTRDGFTVKVDHPSKPGAFRQRYRGGVIRMKDKYLTIPARSEFYGRPATDFTNLRLAVFRSGSIALVVGGGGAGRVDFGTGTERSVRGAGAKSAGTVAYWLRQQVTQEPDHGVIPTPAEYRETVQQVLASLVQALVSRRGGGT